MPIPTVDDDTESLGGDGLKNLLPTTLGLALVYLSIGTWNKDIVEIATFFKEISPGPQSFPRHRPLVCQAGTLRGESSQEDAISV